MPELENKLAAPEGCAPLTCSALDAALALVDFGPCKTAARQQDWMTVASAMCAHCEGAEDVNLAAARIIAAEYRKALAVIEAIEERYIDGCDTYEDWKFMGDCARTYLRPPRLQYNELLMAVGNKYEGESRHETALRYIQEAERGSDTCSANIRDMPPT